MNVKITTNREAIKLKINKAKGKALTITSNEALKDCNYYCKEDQEGLIDSSIVASEPEKGILRWDTVYAKRQYYLDATNKDKNTNASKMWAHKARAKHGDEWKAKYQRAFKEDLK